MPGPGRWRARALLEASAQPIEDVAAACGYRSAATLRHHFRARLGVAPAAYRRRFGPPDARPGHGRS
jgi:AraC family transcriptional activator FtrA